MSFRGSVLITGVTGFTGPYLRTALASRNYAVVGIADRGVSHAGDRVLDLLDRAAVRRAVQELRPDYIVHLAGVSFPAHDSPEDFHRIHEDGSRNLLEAVADCAHACRKVVLASSAYVYGCSTEVEIAETAPLAPVDPYGKSKLRMELLAQAFFDRVAVLLVRPFNYTGVGQSERFIIPKLVAHFRRRAAEIELADTSVTREFLDVRDVADIYVDLIESGARSEAVNLASGVGHTVDSVIERLTALTGVAPRIARNSALDRKTAVQRLVGSPDKLKRLTRTSFRPLGETLKWMLET
jgi:nucleoside-diphosphate-sugar epimerase